MSDETTAAPPATAPVTSATAETASPPVADSGQPPPVEAAPPVPAPATPPAPTIDVAALVRQQAELQTQAQQMGQQRAWLEQQAAQLRPYHDLQQRIAAAKGAPDLVADLIAEATGMSFADVTKTVATRGPTSPEAMQAMTLARQLGEQLQVTNARLEGYELERTMAPMLEKYPALRGSATPAQVVQAVRAGRQHDPNFSPEALMGAQEKFLWDQAASTLKSDPKRATEILKSLGLTAALAPARPAPGIGNSSAAAAPPPPPAHESDEDRMKAAMAVGRALLNGGGQ